MGGDPVFGGNLFVFGLLPWFYMIKHVGAPVASSFLFAEPLIKALFVIIFVGEELSLFVVAGGFLIFIGVYLVTKRRAAE